MKLDLKRAQRSSLKAGGYPLHLKSVKIILHSLGQSSSAPRLGPVIQSPYPILFRLCAR
jgi:hypothetical protein